MMSVRDYMLLSIANEEYNYLCRILNRNGAANMTVCPECGCDDFTHVESCSLGKTLNS
jgi:hypothetical protein